MIESNKKTYYIWGEFSHTDFTLLNKLHQRVNDLLNGPDFIVHLTLSGPFYDLDEATIGGIEDLAVTNNKIEMTTNGYGIEDNIFQSFYVQIQKSSELINLKGRLDDLLSITPKDFNPHISLFYGNIRQTLKQEVISKLDTPPEVITLDRISIVEIVDDVESWEVLYAYPLIQKLNAKLTLGRPV